MHCEMAGLVKDRWRPMNLPRAWECPRSEGLESRDAVRDGGPAWPAVGPRGVRRRLRNRSPGDGQDCPADPHDRDVDVITQVASYYEYDGTELLAMAASAWRRINAAVR